MGFAATGMPEIAMLHGRTDTTAPGSGTCSSRTGPATRIWPDRSRQADQPVGPEVRQAGNRYEGKTTTRAAAMRGSGAPRYRPVRTQVARGRLATRMKSAADSSGRRPPAGLRTGCQATEGWPADAPSPAPEEARQAAAGSSVGASAFALRVLPARAGILHKPHT